MGRSSRYRLLSKQIAFRTLFSCVSKASVSVFKLHSQIVATVHPKPKPR